GSYQATAVRALVVLAQEQGDAALVQRLLREELPAGAGTPGGAANFSTVVLLQGAAAARGRSTGGLGGARAGRGAPGRRVGGRGGGAGGQLGWAAYHRAAGDRARSRRHAEDALACASEPRQPLALAAAQRLLGELDSADGRRGIATERLEQALTLANACAAP